MAGEWAEATWQLAGDCGRRWRRRCCRTLCGGASGTSTYDCACCRLAGHAVCLRELWVVRGQLMEGDGRLGLGGVWPLVG